MTTDLSSKFSTLEAEITSIGDEAHLQRVTIEGTLEDIQTELSSIHSDMLLMKKALIAAMGQNDPCATCPPPSLITPVTSPTAHPINADHCKRAQAFIHAISQLSAVLGGAADSSVTWSPSLVISGINEVITTLITGGTVPLPSFTEAIEIGGELITYGVENLFRHDSLQAQFDSISSGLLAPLFAAGSPAAAQTAYASFISSSALPADEATLLEGLGFNALVSYYFDPASTPDLTGYDGSLCGLPAGCLNFGPEDILVVHTEDGDKTIPDWTIYGLTLQTNIGHDNAVWVLGDWSGWSWTITGGHAYHVMNGLPATEGTGDTGTFPTGLGAQILVFQWTSVGTLVFCPPGG